MTRYPKGNPGAASTDSITWRSINWNKVRKDVHRLQVRIAKAVQQKRWGKVQSLQRVLVTSWSARALAVKTVTSNKGKNTPGVDGVIWKTAKAKLQAIDTLRRHGYKCRPLRRTYILKSNGKKRPLGIPTMKDRAMQALYALALKPVAETLADPHSYGFRPKRSVADATMQCHIVLSRKVAPQWILEGDIKACFDRISHQWMLDNIPMDKVILRQWLEAGFIERDVFYETREGTPQGGIISPILANMALDGIQEMLRLRCPKGGKVNFIRYADDFICTAETPEILREIVKPAIENLLQERGMSLSEEKTLITHIDDGFDFLGFNVRKFNGKLLIQPAQVKIKAFRERIKKKVRGLRRDKAWKAISSLNLLLRGWGNYYRHAVSSKVFSSIDHYVFQTIWRELGRLHPKKSAAWKRAKYFPPRGRNRWIFSGEQREKHRNRRHFLFQMGSLKIKRHVKLKSKATPFDPAYTNYLKRREAIKKATRMRERVKRSSLTTPWMGNRSGRANTVQPGRTRGLYVA
jgi:RNA-directed DNA polymerase